MKPKLYVVLSLVVIASMLLGSCVTATPQVIEKVITATPQPTKAAAAAPATAPVAKVSPKFKNPDTLTLITGAGEPESLDPAWYYDTAGSTIGTNIYEGLVAYNRERTDDFIPALATEWKSNSAGTEWTFKIRQGVKFHKGGTLEPHDVAYSQARAMLQGRIDGYLIINYEAYFGSEYQLASIKDFALKMTGKKKWEELTADDQVKVCEAVKSVVVADDAAGTVTFKLKNPVPWLFALMSQQFMGGILDQEWMKEKGDWNGDCTTWTKYADPASQNTVLFKEANGTGPYVLDHWTPGEEIVLTAFKDYWRKEPMWKDGPSGVAKIQRVVLKNISEWGTRLAMLEAGDADWIYVPAQYRPQLEAQIKSRCTLDPESCKPANEGGYIRAYRDLAYPSITPAQLNWQINVEGGNPYTGSGKLDGNGIPANFFSDIHVRKAFNYCFDFNAMVKDALAGEGVQAQGPIPMGMPGYFEGQKPAYTYDLEKCKQEFMLADVNGNGVTADKDNDDVWKKGFYIQIAYNTGNDTRRLSSEILKAGIEKVNPNFKIAVVGMPWAVMLESRRQGKLPIYVGGWHEDFHDSHNWALSFLHSQGPYGRIINMPKALADEFDALINKGASLVGADKRRPVYEEIQKKAVDQGVNIWMYQVLESAYYQNWVEGYIYNPALGNPGYGWIYSMSKKAP